MITSNVTWGLYDSIHKLRYNQMCEPRMAVLIPTYKCNQNCYYCFYKDCNNGYTIPYDNMIEILNQLVDLGVRSVEFCGGGEPLLMPDIKKVFEFCRLKKLRIGLLTNGTLFKDDIADTFLKYGTYVRFSLDTVDPAKYQKIRRADDCMKVIENIENALKLKLEMNYLCEISLKVSLTKETTIKDIEDVVDFAKKKQIYSIQIKNVWDKDGKFYSKIEREDIKHIRDTNAKVFKKIGAKKKMYEPCWLNPIQTTIDPYGDIYICCYYQERKDTHKIGNLFQIPLTELWGSKEHWKVIQGIKVEDCIKHDCRIMKYMNQTHYLLKFGDWYFL